MIILLRKNTLEKQISQIVVMVGNLTLKMALLYLSANYVHIYFIQVINFSYYLPCNNHGTVEESYLVYSSSPCTYQDD